MPKPNDATISQWYPVHWREGMFLRPHHLQSADRHARDMLATSEDWFHPFNYGFYSLAIDRAALRKDLFKLDHCEARFPDGTRLRVPTDGTPDPVPLRGGEYKRTEGVDVLLAVPRWRWQEGRPNVAESAEVDGTRFTVEMCRVEDENTGDNTLEMEVRRIRCRLLLAPQRHDGYVTLPVARLIQSHAGHAMLDPGFVPPVLAFDAVRELYKPVQTIHKLMWTRIEELVARLPGSGQLFESHDTGEAERVLKLTALNAAYSELASLAYTPGMTPLAVYQQLCRLAGSLAIFTSERRPGELPPYDHGALADCFNHVLREIRMGIDASTYSAYEVRQFEGSLGGSPGGPTVERLEVRFDPEWRTEGRRVFLGVRALDAELSREECDHVLASLDMKLGGAASAGEALGLLEDDLRRVPVSRPKALPEDRVYYRIEGEDADWHDVIVTRTLVIQLTAATPVVARPGRPEVSDNGLESEAPPVVRALQVGIRKIEFYLFIL